MIKMEEKEMENQSNEELEKMIEEKINDKKNEICL